MSKAFSVIVPTFNRAEFVAQTIDCILQQTLQPIEIIVVDDGSNDNTAEVVRRFGGIVHLLQIPNCGPAGARHAGVQNSTGEFLAFCDDDDLWHPDHLFNLARVLDHEMVPFAFSNFIQLRSNKWEGEDKFSFAPPDYWSFVCKKLDEDFAIVDAPLYPHLINFVPILPSCSAISRRYYDRMGGYNQAFGFVPAEDLEFTLRCVCHGSVGIVFKPTVGYRFHSGNRSGIKPNQYFLSVAKHLSGEVQIWQYSRDHHPVDPAWREAINKRIIEESTKGFEFAFVASDIKLVRQFEKNIPKKNRSFKFKVKTAIAALPDFIAIRLSKVLAGERKSTVR